MLNKTIYKFFCEKHEEIPVFSQYWWLNSVCGEDNWDVSLYKVNEEIVASLPYFITKKIGLKFIIQPKFTQKLGPFILDEYKNESLKIVSTLISELPKFNFFDQNIDANSNTIRPFYWNGFDNNLSYTLKIKNISDNKIIIENFHHNRKQDIKIAEKNNIKTFFQIDALAFYEFHKKNLKKKI